MSIFDTNKENNQNRMVTGLFPDRASAERAYNSISTRGYGKDDVNLMMSDSTRKTHFGDTEIVTAAFVEEAHRRDMQVHVWTIDDADEMVRLVDLGVDGIMTDRNAVLKDVLTAKGRW